MKHFYYSFLPLVTSTCCLSTLSAAQIHLSDLPLGGITQSWGEPHANLSVVGTPLNIANTPFSDGVGTHAESTFKINLHQSATRFQAKVGVNQGKSKGSVEFFVKLDGKTLWRSGVMKASDPAKSVDVSLKGGKELTLYVSNGGDSNDSDHADWVNAIITYQGKKPSTSVQPIHYAGTPKGFHPIKEPAGGPPNKPTKLLLTKNNQSITLQYNGTPLLEGQSNTPIKASTESDGEKVITQTIHLTSSQPLHFTVHASSEALSAETKGSAQKKFPLVRTSHGLSTNLRNNAIYDRHSDWMLEFPEGTVIKPSQKSDGTTAFSVTVKSDNPDIIFRPRYYQKHKNIPYFAPWNYKIRKDSITGWSSWWAYFRKCGQKEVDAVMDVWQEKHLADFGYRFIQLDDVFQGGEDGDIKHASANYTRGYWGGYPKTWLKWKKNGFPGGIEEYVRSIKEHGFEPALWIGCYFTDKGLAETHPEYFVRGKDGKPTMGRWVTYVLDATNPVVADKYIRPTFRGLKKAGMKYIKIDQLRHMLYDNLNANQEYLMKQGKRPDDLLRAYLKIAREELGEETFILACWGVLPEVVGLVDACRIAGDGFGPVSMQQYNSWNGIVWRNDPDHCDVSPKKSAVGVGNVTKTAKITPAQRETIIRPALASLSGSLLLLSDRPDVYKNDANLIGVKRSSPVLFSVPGQLYDFDSSRTDKVKTVSRFSVKSGEHPSPIDAAQFGHVNPFWLNEFNTPAGNWNVLHRLNWDKKKTVGSTTVQFADLGLDPSKDYLVYEFWDKKFYGSLHGQIKLDALAPMGIASYAIREKLNRPQLVTTSRHFSQGAAEIKKLTWADNKLVGRSHIVIDDPYTIIFTVPQGFTAKSFTVDGKKVPFKVSDNIGTATYTPTTTKTVTWTISF